MKEPESAMLKRVDAFLFICFYYCL